jgi:hypothetical protein
MHVIQSEVRALYSTLPRVSLSEMLQNFHTESSKNGSTPDFVFPSHFVLPDILSIINPVFSYGVLDHDIEVAATEEAARWYCRWVPFRLRELA